MKGQTTGGFFSVSLGHLHKVPACSPPNHSIYPWNSCRTLPSPSLPLCQSLCQAPFVSSDSKYIVRGHESRFFCIITLVLSVQGPSPIQTHVYCSNWNCDISWGICSDCTKGYPDKVQLRVTDLNSNGKEVYIAFVSVCAPFTYFVVSVERFLKKSKIFKSIYV